VAVKQTLKVGSDQRECPQPHLPPDIVRNFGKRLSHVIMENTGVKQNDDDHDDDDSKLHIISLFIIKIDHGFLNSSFLYGYIL